MEIHKETFEHALVMAIAAQEQLEKTDGYTTDSAMLATWKLALEAIRKGENLVIKKL